ncbi:MAG: DUF2188 domain-containing protein [Leadbetterella sp.]|nr:DUF2188 domain-containing protein [Leadbetterella sp.]
MPNPKRMHLTFNREQDMWQAKREGADRVSVKAETKKEVDESAREIARNNRLELVIHDKKGKIIDSDSFGKDPYPPKDIKH